MGYKSSDKIPGGYYIKARKIQESKIAHAPPYVREIWDWLIKEANHSDNEIAKRGECIRSYKDIQEGLHWMVGWRKEKYSKSQCENAMKWLTRNTMITTKRTTRGLRINIVNYDRYQDPKNYESHNGNHRSATALPHDKQECTKNENTKPKKSRRRRKSPPNPNTNKLIDLYIKKFKSYVGSDTPKINDKIDRAQAKILVNKFTMKKLDELLEQFFDSDYYLIKQGSYSFSDFARSKVINRLLVELADKKGRDMWKKPLE